MPKTETRTIYRDPADFAAGERPIDVPASRYEEVLLQTRRAFPQAIGVCSTVEDGRKALTLDLTAARI